MLALPQSVKRIGNGRLDANADVDGFGFVGRGVGHVQHMLTVATQLATDAELGNLDNIRAHAWNDLAFRKGPGLTIFRASPSVVPCWCSSTR